jgi:NAD(P)-dependent dehydrogenase (short-subunit alcohol dehydrogenase family)
MSDPDARTYIVTGGTRGIGTAVVAALLRHSAAARVVMLARDPTRAAGVQAELARQCGRPPEVVVGDLASLVGARAAAQALAAAAPRLDVLVHNAGIWPSRRRLGPEGYEEAFVTNHLAPFLLTRALSAGMPRGGRVVQVTAGLYPLGRFDPERTPMGADWSRLKTYAHTKLANLLATRRWAEELRPRGIDVNSVHPGVVRTHLGAAPDPIGWLVAASKLLWASPAKGARGPVRLATDPALAGVTGRYFDQLEEKPFLAPATDAALVEAAWRQAEELTR